MCDKEKLGYSVTFEVIRKKMKHFRLEICASCHHILRYFVNGDLELVQYFKDGIDRGLDR